MSLDFSSRKHTLANGQKVLAMAGSNAGYMETQDIKAYVLEQAGQPNGPALLDGNGKLPTTQLPDMVDDVLVYSSKSQLPAAGQSGKLYVITGEEAILYWNNLTNDYQYIATMPLQGIDRNNELRAPSSKDVFEALALRELKGNKSQTIDSSETKYPSNKAVHDEFATVKGAIQSNRLAIEETRQILKGYDLIAEQEVVYEDLDSASIPSNAIDGSRMIPSVEGKTVVVDGQLKASTPTAIEVTGKNLWDGTVSGGRSPFIAVSRTDLYIDNGNWQRIECYDSNQTLIGNVTYSAVGRGYALTCLGGTAYIRVVVMNSSNTENRYVGYGSTGAYVPYYKETIQLTTDPLNGVNNARDRVFFEKNANGLYDKKKQTVMSVVDLGTLSWSIPSNVNRWQTTFSGHKFVNNNTIFNAISDKYIGDTAGNVYGGVTLNTVSNEDGDKLTVYNGSRTDMPTGTLVYELATPTVTTLATDLTYADVSAMVEGGGQITVVNSEPVAKPTVTTSMVVRRNA